MKKKAANDILLLPKKKCTDYNEAYSLEHEDRKKKFIMMRIKSAKHRCKSKLKYSEDRF